MKKITELNQTEITIIGGGVHIFTKILIGPAVCLALGGIASHSILSDSTLPLSIKVPIATMTNAVWAAAGIFIGFVVLRLDAGGFNQGKFKPQKLRG